MKIDTEYLKEKFGNINQAALALEISRRTIYDWQGKEIPKQWQSYIKEKLGMCDANQQQK